MLSYICMIGPFIQNYIIPVALFYSLTFWGVYVNDPVCDLLFYEAMFKFINYVLLILAAGYVT